MTTTISGTAGVTFPAGGLGNPAGAVVGTTDTQTLTNKTIQGGAITSGTAVASTSGTSIDFTSIPSWVKRITVMFQGVSTNGTSVVLAQIGSGSVDATGYSSAASVVTTVVATASQTTGFGLVSSTAAIYVLSGSAVISLQSTSTNTWCISGTLSILTGSTGVFLFGGSKALSGVLDRVRITTVNGTDTFDAGSINILYE